MKTFIHGGRIGDLIYALYTVKEMGGGNIILVNHHTPGWGVEYYKSLTRFLSRIPYISGHCWVEKEEDAIEIAKTAGECFNFIDAERSYNPDKFPEWHGKSWPGNIHLAKRYATYFNIPFFANQIWLQPGLFQPRVGSLPEHKFDIVFHAPVRRVTNMEHLKDIVVFLSKKYRIVVTGDELDEKNWLAYIGINKNVTYFSMLCRDMADQAYLIQESTVFLGAVSSGHAVSEAMGKPRYVQQADGCDNVIPTLVINGMRVGEIARHISNAIEDERSRKTKVL